MLADLSGGDRQPTQGSESREQKEKPGDGRSWRNGDLSMGMGQERRGRRRWEQCRGPGTEGRKVPESQVWGFFTKLSFHPQH